MKLTELNPRWLVIGERKVGMSFDCPHCRKILIGVHFKNPVGGGEPLGAECLWERDGETFETMTLTPSIDASEPKQPLETITMHNKGHWHGFITNGEVVGC